MSRRDILVVGPKYYYLKGINYEYIREVLRRYVSIPSVCIHIVNHSPFTTDVERIASSMCFNVNIVEANWNMYGSHAYDIAIAGICAHSKLKECIVFGNEHSKMTHLIQRMGYNPTMIHVGGGSTAALSAPSPTTPSAYA